MERPLRTQLWITGSAQAALAVGSLIGAVLMLGPFQGAERLLLLTDKEAHAIAFFLFTLLGLMAAPRLRKNDLALVALALASASEAAQSAVGRSASMEDLMADAAGIFAAWALMWAAQARRRLIGRNWGDGSAPQSYNRRAGDRSPTDGSIPPSLIDDQVSLSARKASRWRHRCIGASAANAPATLQSQSIATRTASRLMS